MQTQSSYQVHMNTISNGEFSDPLCDSVNRVSDFSQIVELFWFAHHFALAPHAHTRYTIDAFNVYFKNRKGIRKQIYIYQ